MKQIPLFVTVGVLIAVIMAAPRGKSDEKGGNGRTIINGGVNITGGHSFNHVREL